jgi:hypothetical protein
MRCSEGKRLSERLLLLLLLAFSALWCRASEGETGEGTQDPVHRFWIHGSGLTTFTENSLQKGMKFRPRVGVDLIQANIPSVSFGLALSTYEMAPLSGSRRTDVQISAGYWILEHKLGLLGVYGQSSTQLAGWNSAWSDHYGLEARYRHPVSEKVTFTVSAFWMRYARSVLRRDTGVPVTTNPWENLGCDLISTSFGFGGGGCGSLWEDSTVPWLNTIAAGVGVELRL